MRSATSSRRSWVPHHQGTDRREASRTSLARHPGPREQVRREKITNEMLNYASSSRRAKIVYPAGKEPTTRDAQPHAFDAAGAPAAVITARVRPFGPSERR